MAGEEAALAQRSACSADYVSGPFGPTVSIGLEFGPIGATSHRLINYLDAFRWVRRSLFIIISKFRGEKDVGNRSAKAQSV